ncbi:glycosyltransferase involved in cell wall biosynthesis [Mucilaginibacter yixingensis]|uniref:Glycosyltransferase involved in cell wall biosynthesis n=1 Tax=Mucilaginibacter yixingensis TaxID=1295612 RepID=A0A2T5JCE1_9SPHI|nr:glycosyltransferase family 4 protein [Mucilaginibacter yixingensis]PTQ99335.1 glycosyltransferase involved in cell wall biosynthesis [Mucilaginibacter yixingensis]
MKVIILCANYEPGGAQRAVVRLHKQLSKDITCECWFMHRKSADFTDSPKLILNKKISSAGDVLKICSRLYKEFKKEKPDAVISFLPYANILGLFIAYLCGIKKRISSHRNLSDKELSGSLKKMDSLWASRGIYTGITAVSRSTKKSFSYYPKAVYDKVKVINNGISFTPSALSQTECRIKLNLPELPFIIGNVGRLVEQKNHQLLISILPELPEILLVIIGKGELKASLDKQAEDLGVQDRLLIIDELNAADIPHFLKAINIFVMPSNFEGMSNALAEALYAGVPIVSSDVESQSDVLLRESDGLQAGLMASNNNEKQWIDAIMKIKNNETLREDICKKALIRSSDFTIEHMAQGFREML